MPEPQKLPDAEELQLFHEFLDLIALIQRRNRFVSSAYGLPLGLSDAHALVEIDRHEEGVSASLLGRNICLKKASVSYLISRLRRRRLLQVRESRTDKRAKVVALSVSGKRLLAQLDARANQQTELLSKDLTPERESALVGYLERFSDIFGVPRVSARYGESLLRAAIRRATRALGLTTDAIFDSTSISALQWHMLTEIAADQEAKTARQLGKALGVKANTVSVCLSGLEKEGFIKQEVFSSDRRKKAVLATPRGRQFLSRIREDAALSLKTRLASFSPESVREFVGLLSIIAGKPQTAKRHSLQAALFVELVSGEGALKQLRGKFVDEAINSGLKWNLSGTLLYARNTVYVAWEEATARGVIEFEISADKAYVVNAAVFSGAEGVLSLEGFIEAAASLFGNQHPYVSVELPRAKGVFVITDGLAAESLD